MYEGGGVHVLDELDAADPNLLLTVNTALANGYCNVPHRPDKPRAERHKDFVQIATANTVGRGADRMYVGRGQLDAATLDRFQIGMVEVTYDMGVEEMIAKAHAAAMNGRAKQVYDSEARRYVPAFAERGKTKAEEVAEALAAKGFDALETLWYVRDAINRSTGMRRVMSTRFVKDACVMMEKGGWTIKEVLEAFFCGWSAEEVAKML